MKITEKNIRKMFKGTNAEFSDAIDQCWFYIDKDFTSEEGKELFLSRVAYHKIKLTTGFFKTTPRDDIDIINDTKMAHFFLLLEELYGRSTYPLNDFIESDLIRNCEKSASYLEEREGIRYEEDSEIPFTGKHLLWHENGQKEGEINYKDGKQNGITTMWHENGRKSLETNYKDGKENGIEIGWYEDGERSWEKNYKDGIIVEG